MSPMYAACTSQMVPPTADLVIIEFVQNDMYRSGGELRLVSELSCALCVHFERAPCANCPNDRQGAVACARIAKNLRDRACADALSTGTEVCAHLQGVTWGRSRADSRSSASSAMLWHSRAIQQWWCLWRFHACLSSAGPQRTTCSSSRRTISSLWCPPGAHCERDPSHRLWQQLVQFFGATSSLIDHL